MTQENHATETVNPIVLFSINHPKIITWLMTIITVIIIALAALPNFFPEKLAFLHTIKVDTDPENMLSDDEAVRVYNKDMKAEFSLSDIVVVGITNKQHANGVFNSKSLANIYELAQFSLGIKWPDEKNPGKTAGVIAVDVLAPSTVDNIEQGGPGTVNFSWLMPEPPKSDADALLIRDRALKIPFLNGTLVSDDGEAIALYLPITSKNISYQVREQLLAKIAEFTDSEEEYYITGLPVAQDTFGVEMFKQMAISAPLAMLVIFLLLWWFFKRLIFVTSPMIVAMVCALSTMGVLIISGHTIHIMSSMIPIFIMPIAILDAVHILSDFFDRYNTIRDKRKTIIHVMNELFTPMLITTLTTIAGFASLALTPIPPVQVFGIFIAIGVFLAWIWSVTFIPAFIVSISDEKLASFITTSDAEAESTKTFMARLLAKTGQFTYNHALLILLFTLASVGVAGYGISKINVNDNPIKWFTESHIIRVADRVLNEHFGGTYMAYLALEVDPDATTNTDFKPALLARLDQAQLDAIADEYANGEKIFDFVKLTIVGHAGDQESLSQAINNTIDQGLDSATDEEFDTWDQVQLFIDSERQRSEIFKQPETLTYLADLQNYINSLNVVGKSNSLSDVVKTVHRELLLGKQEEFRIPDSSSAIAQTLITYQNSHRPHDLWHFVTPDFRKSSLWIQMTSGDNQDMSYVEEQVADYIASHPMPYNLQANWFGLTHINVVWQDKMVSGMFESFAGSFIVVLIMMVLLFRSFAWGLLSMVPLTVTVGLIYGIIGLIGKDYDMPVAVLSSLSIGLAVDYAIHFLSRAREYTARYGSWEAAIEPLFSEPAMAIARNAIVVGVGFLPLLAAPLVPYQTVGVFIAAILFMAGVSSLLILPALITLMPGVFFRNLNKSA
ncbi:efflux RND transporter permease subunit [Methyloprofundus sp.]|uniref:efflux RND transporter permease subunit n=1 Tax=Methyloprofundus sp. TaxID=2020875 RepID=UPI003D12AB6B